MHTTPPRHHSLHLLDRRFREMRADGSGKTQELGIWPLPEPRISTPCWIQPACLGHVRRWDRARRGVLRWPAWTSSLPGEDPQKFQVWRARPDHGVSALTLIPTPLHFTERNSNQVFSHGGRAMVQPDPPQPEVPTPRPQPEVPTPSPQPEVEPSPEPPGRIIKPGPPPDRLPDKTG